MKKGINIGSFEQGKDLKSCMELAKKAGFDGIELRIFDQGELRIDSADEEIKAIRKTAEAVGIELKSLVSGLYWKYSFTHDSADVRQKAKETVKRHLHGASILGADTILVIPGLIDIPESAHVPYDIAYERSLEAFKELGDEAAKYKINIGLENVWNKFLLSPLEFRDFIDKTGSEYVGCYFDVGNILFIGYPEDWISILGNRIKKVHFKDYRKNAGAIGGFVDLLAGDVDFKAVMSALKKIGYDDYITAEMGTYKQYPDQILFNTAASMDRIIRFNG